MTDVRWRHDSRARAAAVAAKTGKRRFPSRGTFGIMAALNRFTRADTRRTSGSGWEV
jgi:hypothetical protein